MTQTGHPTAPGDQSKRHVRENVFGMLWATALVVTGCLVLNGLSQNARRDECLMRGAALCSEAEAFSGYRSQRQTRAAAHYVDLATYLKGSRNW
jgi:hypothetical protein